MRIAPAMRMQALAACVNVVRKARLLRSACAIAAAARLDLHWEGTHELRASNLGS